MKFKFRKYHFAPIAFLLLVACVIQPDWTKIYDGPGGSHDYARALNVDQNGITLLGQVSDTNDEYALGILSYNLEGSLQSETLINMGEQLFIFKGFIEKESAWVIGHNSKNDFVTKVDLEQKAIAWENKEFTGLRDVKLFNDNVFVTGDSTIMLDPLGNKVWSHTYDETFPWAYGGEPTQLRGALKLAVNDQGDVFAGGYEYQKSGAEYDRNFWLSKYSYSGDLLWQRTWGGDGNDQVIAVSPDGYGGVCVTGEYRGNGVVGAYLTKRINGNGDVLWENTIHSGFAARPTDLTVDQEGNCIVTGIVAHRNLPGQRLTVKYSPNGAELWREFETGFNEYTLAAYTHAVTSDQLGRIYVSGQHKTRVFSKDGDRLAEADDGTNSANIFALNEATTAMYLATEKTDKSINIQLTRYSIKQ